MIDVSIKALWCCIVDGYYCGVVDRHCFFFSVGFWYVPHVSRKLISSCRVLTFCNWYYLFTLSFLSKQTRHGRNVVSYSFLFIYGRGIAQAKCGVESKSTRRRLVLQLQSAEVSQKVTSRFVWSLTKSVNVKEGIQDAENCTRYSSSVSALFTVYS